VRETLTTVSSPAYRAALAFVTLVPVPLAFIDQPLAVIRTFTIVGSLFVPFLAAVLLYLNNARLPLDSAVPRNSWLANAGLVLALVVFAGVGASEAGWLRLR
jgi:cobalamin synthase